MGCMKQNTEEQEATIFTDVEPSGRVLSLPCYYFLFKKKNI